MRGNMYGKEVEMKPQVKDSDGNLIDVKTLRTRLNLTQVALAKVLGVDEITIRRWEHGQARIHQANLRQLNRLAKRTGKLKKEENNERIH